MPRFWRRCASTAGKTSVPSVPALVAFHGPLMVGGFLGTVIGLERAVALGRGWAYVAPLATALGAVALVAGGGAGQWWLAAGSAQPSIRTASSPRSGTSSCPRTEPEGRSSQRVTLIGSIPLCISRAR